MEGRSRAFYAVVFALVGTLALLTPACGGGGGGGGGGEDDGADVTDFVGDEPTDVEDGRSEDARDDGRDGADGDADGDADVVPGSCGDGIVDPGEECDDGNTVPGDGCENDCTFTCVGNDECDDGQLCNGAETCTDHMCLDGTPPAEGTPCTLSTGDAGACRSGLCASASCGNGVVDTGEECDDGNTDNTDACLTSCQNATCGDSYVRAGVEECDDGNAVAGDGCESDCTFTCAGDTECSDGELCNGAETCGATHVCVAGTPPAEGTACTLPTGGAGACRGGLCAAAACGNGVVDAGEECDDGNADNTDACLTSCRNATCGDGYIRTGTEDCDGAAPRSCTTTCGSTGSQACTACRWDTVCTPPAEICNGVDDDCDGTIDNGFTCAPSTSQSCSTSCGSAGSQTCSSACAWGSCAAPAEICNALDDDCDGAIDNGFACVRGTSGTCTTSCASTGARTCDSTCAWGTCTPPAETCNGADDDCDGAIDNGFACVRAATRTCHSACDPAGTDTGTQTCDSSCAWGSCAAPAEVCNGRDDDCDGACDDGFACCAGQPTVCTTSCGSIGVGTCSAACALPGGTSCTPPTETCNGRDDDCDLATDESFTCIQGATRACTVGTCTGTQTCNATCSGWGTCTVTAPANDSCTGAIPIVVGTDPTGSTSCAANDYSATCGGGAPGNDVVYRLDIVSRSAVTLDTDGATWDTVLHLHSGTTCPGTEVACNDDIGGGNMASRITTTLDPGTYWVVVDGYTAATAGAFTLHVTVRPAGDECADAIPLTLTAGRTTVTGSTAGYTPSTASCPAGDTANDVWYVFRLTQREQVFINTYGSAFDTQLGLLTGCGMMATTCEDDDCGVNQDQIVRTLAAGTYYILLDGYGSASGAYTLNVEHLPVALDGTARALPAGVSTQTGNTMSMIGGSAVTGSCGGATAPEHSFFWTTCPADVGGAFTASTCSVGTAFDTVIYVRSGATGTDLGCNDDGTSAACGGIGSELPGATGTPVTIPTGAGLFGFYVDGYGTAAGNYRAAVTRP
jgi:cysteine-rich repeat protein